MGTGVHHALLAPNLLHNDCVSFDIFLQDFSDDAPDRSREIRGVIAPFLDDSAQNVITADGSAAIFGLDTAPLTGVMINDVTGDLVWQVIFEAVVAANWTLMPVGCPVCIVDESQRATVPDEAADEGVTLVRSGSELKHVVTG